MPTFDARHVRAALRHFQEMTLEFQQAHWKESIGKGSKLIEAVMKALDLHTAGTPVPDRRFKVSTVINRLRGLSEGSYDDTIRLTIPRACEFAYDIASNRGARHDSDVDPGEMDARAMLMNAAWVLAEMLRYSQSGTITHGRVREHIDGLTQRRYPVVEEVDGRVYFHVPDSSARDVALMSLWHKYPGRMGKNELVETIRRHARGQRHFTEHNARVALTRISPLVDEDRNGRLRLLQPGLKAAEEMIASAGRSP